jgi:hypothetical protein
MTNNTRYDAARIAQETQMFGKSLQDVEFEMVRATRLGYDRLFYAMSILSDAQMATADGNVELARQWINKAKYHIDMARQEQELKKVA